VEAILKGPRGAIESLDGDWERERRRRDGNEEIELGLRNRNIIERKRVGEDQEEKLFSTISDQARDKGATGHYTPAPG
jgi:hypothetical protein